MLVQVSNKRTIKELSDLLEWEVTYLRIKETGQLFQVTGRNPLQLREVQPALRD